jgi:hypothetical protein
LGHWLLDAQSIAFVYLHISQCVVLVAGTGRIEVTPMPYQDPESLALKMNSLQRWLDGGEGASTQIIRYFDHAFAAVTVDPTSTASAASFNRNRIRLCGGRGCLLQSSAKWRSCSVPKVSNAFLSGSARARGSKPSAMAHRTRGRKGGVDRVSHDGAYR